MDQRFYRLSEEKQERIVMAGIREFGNCSFAEASTDRITEDCGISKGLLFHYFGNKAAFYLYCLENALARQALTIPTPVTSGSYFLQDRQLFYDGVFACLEAKLRLCQKEPLALRFLQMAQAEQHSAVRSEAERLINHCRSGQNQALSGAFQQAVSRLKFKKLGDRRTTEGLFLYMNALLEHYYSRYAEAPETFFAEKSWHKQEMQTYLNLMLEGICR